MRRRPILTAVGTVGTMVALLLGTGHTATAKPGPAPALRLHHSSLDGRLGLQQVPKTPPTRDAIREAGGEPASGEPQEVNPYLGLVPNPGKVNWAYWQTRLRRAGQLRATHLANRKIESAAGPSVEPVFVDELEPDQSLGSDDRPNTAQDLTRFGLATGSGHSGRVPSARVLGTLANGPAPTSFGAAREDDGSIPRATDVRLTGAQSRTRTTGRIGDGPHGSHGDSHGDFDFYKITAGKAGERLVVDLDTPAGTDVTQAKLDSVLTLYDPNGKAITLNDDDGETLDSKLTVTIPKTGIYYVCVGSFESATPRNPFNSSSGRGLGSEGPYSITFGLDADDIDYYQLDLHPGDVLGASVKGAAHELDLRDPEEHLRIGSTQDQSGTYPATSPLPGGGNAVLANVTSEGGPYTIAVTGGAGSYDLTLQVYRPGPESTGASSVQTIFLDFDGAQVNTKVFGGSGVRTLSPFRAFLGRWGLRADQANAAIDAVVRTVRENLDYDFGDGDLGDGVAVRILNSRDNNDPFGQPDVSRVIIGGTADEAGLSTVGISQSIDPGNFDAEESALVLLDDLSSAGGSRSTANPSLNAYFGPTSDRVAFIGQAVGNAASHEAGHYLGSWHTAAFDTVPNLMDQGGNFAMLWGVGPDRLGGTADDRDVDFGNDVFNPTEGFTGRQDTAAVTRWGLSGRR
jgi:hypothetical protein